MKRSHGSVRFWATLGLMLVAGGALLTAGCGNGGETTAGGTAATPPKVKSAPATQPAAKAPKNPKSGDVAAKKPHGKPSAADWQAAIEQSAARKKAVPRSKRQQVTAEQQASLDRAKSQLAGASTEERLKLLHEVSLIERPGAVIFDIVQQALACPEPEVHRAALELMQDYYVPDVLPILQKAIADPDPETRALAVSGTRYVDDPGIKDVLLKGLTDTEEDVRSAVLDVTPETEHEVKMAVFRQAIVAPDEGVRGGVVNWAQFEQSHDAMEILIEGLKSDNAEFREEVGSAIEFLVSQQFSSYDEARAWWQENKGRLDEQLFEIDTTAAEPAPAAPETKN